MACSRARCTCLHRARCKRDPLLWRCAALGVAFGWTVQNVVSTSEEDAMACEVFGPSKVESPKVEGDSRGASEALLLRLSISSQRFDSAPPSHWKEGAVSRTSSAQAGFSTPRDGARVQRSIEARKPPASRAALVCLVRRKMLSAQLHLLFLKSCSTVCGIVSPTAFRNILDEKVEM